MGILMILSDFIFKKSFHPCSIIHLHSLFMFKARELEDGNIGGFIQLRVQLLRPVKQHSLSPTQLWLEKSFLLLLWCPTIIFSGS